MAIGIPRAATCAAFRWRGRIEIMMPVDGRDVPDQDVVELAGAGVCVAGDVVEQLSGLALQGLVVPRAFVSPRSLKVRRCGGG
ncbi:hypothetical protein [Kribbella sp. NPDC049227]|uniref:hypothetical protein n=1 Tax=Kribbella sp. NPDC049227 TaxID=3364113 RepID=UPI00371F3C3B